MNRKERRAMKSQQRRDHGGFNREAVETKIKSAIENADLFVYINPTLPRSLVRIERSLMEQYGMDFAADLMLQAEANRKEVSKRGLDPETFAMLEGKANQWNGEPVPDLHYLWFKGDTFVTTEELVPYDMF
jgi:hypothetical protein